ncbi:ATP-binding protein [Streptantibioticus rubrisoli]|uniref:ATP-binding protein n=1 Tax=Streptantibioticus rubrisoli TaxID=1387313 RepID=A0ABT1PH38_9ACTN|nr:ATP-binding protein [Streptantibioticus rubrisoli]MCQ4044672.1 ATP-binding protein [Streptantibioticus rubrisoli]
MPTYRRTFPGRPEEIRNARHWTRDSLNGSSRVEDAALIVTELGSNALLHTASGDETGTFQVSLTTSGAGITISVADLGSAKTEPSIEHAAEEDLHGRGLGLVSVLAQRVEIDGDDNGRTITAYLTQMPARPVIAC